MPIPVPGTSGPGVASPPPPDTGGGVDWANVAAAAAPYVTAGAQMGVSAYSQAQANKMNLKIAREQMAFQERMSGSAYQRAMEDLRRAGLNPLLAGKVGGASTPSGASAHMEPVVKSGDIERGINTAVALKKLSYEMKALALDNAQREENIMLTAQQRLLTSAKAVNESYNENVKRGSPGDLAMPDVVRERRARMSLMELQRRMLLLDLRYGEYGLPAARIQGSSAAGYINVGAKAASAVGAIGLTGLLRKPPTIQRSYNPITIRR